MGESPGEPTPDPLTLPGSRTAVFKLAARSILFTGSAAAPVATGWNHHNSSMDLHQVQRYIFYRPAQGYCFTPLQSDEGSHQDLTINQYDTIT